MVRFENLRNERLKHIIRIRLLIVNLLLMLILCASIFLNIYFVILIIPILYALTQQFKLYNKCRYYMYDVKNTLFYETLKKYNRSYYEIIREIDEELNSDYKINEANIYVTPLDYRFKRSRYKNY